METISDSYTSFSQSFSPFQVLDATYSTVIEPIVITKRGATRTDLILNKDSAGRTPGVLVCGDSAVAPLQPHRSGGEEEDTRVAMLRAMISLKANPVAYTNAETGVTALHQACKWASARFPVVENFDDSDSDVTTTGGLQLLRELVCSEPSMQADFNIITMVVHFYHAR